MPSVDNMQGYLQTGMGSMADINKNDAGESMETPGTRLSRCRDEASRRAGKRVSDRSIGRALGYVPTTVGKYMRAKKIDQDKAVEFAQYFREHFGIETSWRYIMFGDTAENVELDWNLLWAINQAMADALEEEGLSLDPLSRKWAELQAFLYELCSRAGRVDPILVKKQIRLACEGD